MQVKHLWDVIPVGGDVQVHAKVPAIMVVILVVRRLVHQAAITHVVVVAMASKSINTFMGQMTYTAFAPLKAILYGHRKN